VRARAIGSALVCVLVAACGGAAHGSSSVSSVASTSSSVSTTTTTATSTASPPSATSTASPPSATSTASRTSGAPIKTTTTSTTATSTAEPAGPHIRAAFAIGAGEVLNPPVISVPSSVAIQLTLTSADRKRHRVLIRTSPPHTLTVAPGGRASIVLAGLPNGRYVILLDGGAGGGSLVVGVQPGP
jgi:hypothetical protein